MMVDYLLGKWMCQLVDQQHLSHQATEPGLLWGAASCLVINDVIVILLFLSLKLTYSGAQVEGKEVQVLYLVLGHEEARILLETCRCEVGITAYWIFVRCCGCECLSPNSILYQVHRLII